MATPVVRALRERHPDASIDFVCSDVAAPLLDTNPNIARVLPLRQRNVPLVLSPEKWRLIRTLRNAHYRFAVLLEGAPRFRRLLERAAISEIRSFRETPFQPDLHSVANNLRAAGFADWQQRSLDYDLVLTPEDDAEAERLLAGFDRSGAPLVGMHAGYGPPRGKKNQGERLRGWGAENFARLGSMLVERGARLLLTGSSDDRAEAEAIAAGLTPGSFLPLAGRTSVRGLAAVIRRLALYISVDSGPAHVAAAVGTPLLVLWGPGILEQTRPISSTAPIRVVRHQVYCAPCYGTPMMKICARNICMEAISPERVFIEAVRLLSPQFLPSSPSAP